MTGKQSHQMDAAEVLETSAEIGLSGDEAKRRLVGHGPNELRVVRRVSPWRVFLEQFGWPLPLSAVGNAHDGWRALVGAGQSEFVRLGVDGLDDFHRGGSHHIPNSRTG
jgi:hypothetical protein